MTGVRALVVLRVYQFIADPTSRNDQHKQTAACIHPRLGPRAAPWCKLLALHHTLSITTISKGTSRPRYDWVIWHDSDLFFHDLGPSILEILGEFAPTPPSASSHMIAWIANNAPWMRDSPVNTGFFVLRNGAASPRAQGFISRWWHFAHAANAHLQGPLYEQAALQRMWPMRGVEALSDGNKTGPEWRYMSETSDGIS